MQPAATPSAREAASAFDGAASLTEPERLPPTPTPEPTPHVGEIRVVDVVQAPSAEVGRRVLAVLLNGDVGTSAILRSIEIQAWVEPVDGSGCAGPPVPTVLRPSHADAVQPVLADLTRAVVVRSLGDAEPDGGDSVLVRFGSGPVPSLNGTFSGWVSFHLPADLADGPCAVEVSGAVVIVAGETTTAALPVTRVDVTSDAERGGPEPG